MNAVRRFEFFHPISVLAAARYGRTFGVTFQNSKAGLDLPQTSINTGGLIPIMSTVTPFNTTSINGSVQTEVQTINLANASGGTWRVAYNGEVSAPLSPSITASQLKSVLDGFNGIDIVTVTGGSGSFTVTFGGTQSTTNMQQIFGDAANASNGSTVRTITTAYDAASQVTSVSDPSSTINYTLDNLGRATTIAQSVNGLTPTVTLNQSFDAMNNRTELKAAIGSTLDFKNTFQYDQLQRLTDILQQGQSGGNAVLAKHVTFAYNALSQRTQIARYQSTGTTNAVATTDFTYDSANRLSGIAHKQGSTNLNTYAYTYDPLSRIASIVSTLEGTDTYSYDQTSQLVGATHTSQSNETYGFDANGNQNTTGFTTGTNNQTTAGLGFTYTFDDEGNRTSKTETATGKVEEYTWDYRNRLTKVVFRNSSGGAIVKQVDYEYDPYNRLVHRTFDADGAGFGAATDQFWVYDEGINAVLQFDGSSASNLSHRYLWSNNVDELLADEQFAGSNTLWGLADHLGSLRDIADLNEGTGVTSITNHRTFNSFGKLISETNAAVDMLFAYTGKQYDEATTLQHNLYRWYDPVLGQWLSEDPLSFSAGDENIRRYVRNGIVDAIDPTGLQEPILTEEQAKLIFAWLGNDKNKTSPHSEPEWPRHYFPSIPIPTHPFGVQGNSIYLSDDYFTNPSPRSNAAIWGTPTIVCHGRNGSLRFGPPNSFRFPGGPSRIQQYLIFHDYLANIALDFTLFIPLVVPGSPGLAPNTMRGAPTNLGPVGSKAPLQVTPGIRELEGHYINDLGRSQPWRAHYDEFGRLIGRTDYNAGNRAAGIPDIHHHTYRWGPGMNPMETGSHLPGAFTP